MHFKTLIFSTLAACSLAAAASGTDRTFVASEADWSDAGNWTPNGVPADGDKAIIPDGGICHVDINNGRADSFEVQSGGQLIIDSGMLLEIDSNSSVADTGEVVLAGSGSVLLISISDVQITGTGSIKGQHNDARIDIATDVTLTLACTLQGQLQVKGLTGGSANGEFVNSGYVEANRENGVLLIHGNTVLGAGSGDWKVGSFSSAKLEFDAGNTSLTGDFSIETGTMQFDAAITTQGGLTQDAVLSTLMRTSS